MEHIFLEISLILIVATACATVAKLLKQPIIPAYILAGILLGPLFFNVIKSGELLEILSTFGIAFLLFLVGIELDLRAFRKIGKNAVVIGIIQMAFAASVGYFINRTLGFSPTESIFLAVALGFSSTIVGLKLIGERKELDALYGQIVIGILLTQDFIAILVLLFFNVFVGDHQGTELLYNIFITVLKGVCLFTLALVSSKYVLKYLFTYLARSSELLFLGSICWCLLFSILSIFLGFSIEVGALLAGVSLSFLPYNFEISFRIKSLRDFFLPVFFAVLGGQLVFSTGVHVLLTTALLAGIVLFVFPILVTGLLLAFGYRAHTSFQAGAVIGQVSEFSFILMGLAYSAGLIRHEIVSLVALIGLVTMTLSSYIIEYNDYLYPPFRKILKKFERKKNTQEDQSTNAMENHIVLFGYNVFGHGAQDVLNTEHDIVVIDHNPHKIMLLRRNGIPHIYGSMADEDILEKANVFQAAYCISTIRSRRDTLHFLRFAKRVELNAKIIVTAFYLEDAKEYYDLGADFVMMPTLLSSDYFTDIVAGDLPKIREDHKKQLEQLIQYEQFI